MQPDFWRNKSVFLTGHTGFKGSWLSLWLTELGAKVTGYALTPPTNPSLFEVAKVAEGMHSIIGDVRDGEALKAALKAAKPDIVIHMAAQPLVRYSYDHPVETYATNVMGTVHLLEAVRAAGGAETTFIVTSDKCYENREQIWSYRENDAMGGHDPYSNSKGCTELVTRAYGKSYFAVTSSLGSLASGRAGNVIGGGDWALDRLVPDIIRGFAEGNAPVIRRPRAVRPWQHVLEPLSGYLTAIEYCAKGLTPEQTPETWNFGPVEADHVDVRTVAEQLCAAWGEGLSPVIQEDPNAVHEAHLLALDAAKARLELGWQPRWRLAQALSYTAEWYKSYHNGANMRDFTLAQIREYNYTKAEAGQHAA